MRALIEEREKAAQEAAVQEDMQSMQAFAQQQAEAAAEESAPESAEYVIVKKTTQVSASFFYCKNSIQMGCFFQGNGV